MIGIVLGYIDAAKLRALAAPLAQTGYGQYLLALLEEPPSVAPPTVRT